MNSYIIKFSKQLANSEDIISTEKKVKGTLSVIHGVSSKRRLSIKYKMYNSK